MTAPVVICTSAFGADKVRSYGQGHFVAMVARAGAHGVEIREELFTERDRPHEALGACIRDAGLFCVYSSTLKLFADGSGQLNETLSDELAIAEILRARYLKVSLGQPPSVPEEMALAVETLGRLLEGTPVRLLIENDQTLSGGRIAPLRHCLEACRTRHLDIGMTFDAGNWYWTGNDPLEAARTLGEFVAYVHCKGVDRSGKQPGARVPDEADLKAWSTLWQHFPAGLPRAVEFPLIVEDDEALIAHAAQQTALLSVLGCHSARQEAAV